MAQPRELEEGVTLEHPNRDKPESRATRVVVTALLIASAVLMAIVLFGGWRVVRPMAVVALAYIVLYLLFAYYIARWRQGTLPIAAGLATIVLMTMFVAVPRWFDRHAVGYTVPTLPPATLGLIVAILVPLQLLLIFFALRGFRQNWHVEVERLPDGSTRKVPAF